MAYEIHHLIDISIYSFDYRITFAAPNILQTYKISCILSVLTHFSIFLFLWWHFALTFCKNVSFSHFLNSFTVGVFVILAKLSWKTCSRHLFTSFYNAKCFSISKFKIFKTFYYQEQSLNVLLLKCCLYV